MQKPDQKQLDKLNPYHALTRKRDKALKRVLAIYVKSRSGDDLDRALDVLSLAHAAVAFHAHTEW